jgi:hypothetical protein
VRTEHLRIAERRFDGEVFLKRNLALHGGSPVVATSCNVMAQLVSTAGRATKKASRDGFAHAYFNDY